MSEAIFPQINGNERDGSSIKIKFLGKYWRGVQSVGYGDALEPNYIYELGSVVPIAMTVGQYKPDDISFEILRTKADEIRAVAKAKAGNKGWGLLHFQIQIHYADGNTPVTDILTGVRVTKVGNEGKAGADAVIEKWTMKPLSLSRGGIYLYK